MRGGGNGYRWGLLLLLSTFLTGQLPRETDVQTKGVARTPR